MNHIKNNKPQEDDDEEEILSRKEFDSANITKMNQESTTISVPTPHLPAWRKVLEERYGKPLVLPAKYGTAPLQFKTEGISLTTWLKDKSKHSTIHIQGRAHYLKFTKSTVPKIFEDVLKILPKGLVNAEVPEATNKRKYETRPSINLECDSCEAVKSDSNALNIHKTTVHTTTVSNPKKQKQTNLQVVSLPSLSLEENEDISPMDMSDIEEVVVLAESIKNPSKVNDTNEKFKCDLCNHVADKMSDLIVHAKEYHPSTLIKCPKCEFETVIKDDIDQHIKSCYISCKECDFVCITTHAMTKHNEQNHTKLVIQFDCHICD